MNLTDVGKNLTVNRNRYRTDSEGVIISCFFNPQKNPYRLIAFQKWYRSIKHLNHRIIECVIGDDKPQLPDTESIQRVHSDSILWHKETLLNNVVRNLPKEFRYIFWVDADVLMSNLNWFVKACNSLKSGANIIQPFEYCVHLDKGESASDYNYPMSNERMDTYNNLKGKKCWRSFCSNIPLGLAGDNNYDKHGHVGFAWGARREVLEACPLYDHALVGGADHIVAHAAAGHIPHKCVTKSFTEDIDNVLAWSRDFYKVVRGKIDYVTGDLYHIWHGDISKRQYLKRIKDFTPESKNIKDTDENGLYKVDKGKDSYVKEYFRQREVDLLEVEDIRKLLNQDEFIEDMGYDLLEQYIEWNSNE